MLRLLSVMDENLAHAFQCIGTSILWGELDNGGNTMLAIYR